MRWWLIAALGIAASLALAGPAGARKPIVSYVDPATDKLAFYDAELGMNVPAPDITIPGPVRRFAVSFDGRFVFYADADKKLHLYDRGKGGERSLPGIDVAAAPAGLTVSDTGLLAFDDNSNGPTRAYDSNTGKFVDTGLADDNGHRQAHLTADGKLLATTCVTGAMHCVVDNDMVTSDSDVFVQDLTTRTDTGFPDDASGTDNIDEEHPCINGDGSLVGADNGAAHKDVFVYDRVHGTKLALPGLNDPDPTKDDVKCVMGAKGVYIGVFDNADNFKLYDRIAQTSTPLPSVTTSPAWFSAPYPPPRPVDRVAPVLRKVAARPRRFRPRGAGGHGTVLRFNLSEAARVRIQLGRPKRTGRSFHPTVTYRRHELAGLSKVGISGRVRRHGRNRPLSKGAYVIRVRATDAAGNDSKTRTVKIRVLPPRR